MKVYFKTNGGKVAVLGTFLPIHKDFLKLYVKKYPLHWITF